MQQQDVFHAYKPLLFSLAYHMLGSVMDAEDCVQEAMLHQFLRACQDGDMDGLLSLLANDIVVYADSGGKAPAARHPISGADRVARYLLGLVRKGPQDSRFRVALINGQPGLIVYCYGVPSVLADPGDA